MKTRHFLSIGIAVGALLAAPFAMAGRGDYETTNYKVVKNEGAFELRDYPTMVVATASMKGDGGNRNSAFMGLFRYISGANEAKQKIAMTTPVFTTPGAGGSAMSFVVPAEVAKVGAPKADSADIELAQRSAGRFAVYRYSGRWTEANDLAAREELGKWLKEQGLKPEGSMEKASYDPPFTLPIFRRNEVMVRVPVTC